MNILRQFKEQIIHQIKALKDENFAEENQGNCQTDFKKIIEELTSNTGIQKTLQLIQNNKKIQEKQKKELRQRFTRMLKQLVALREKQKCVTNKEIIKKLKQFLNNLEFLNQSLVELVNMGFCGGSQYILLIRKKNDFKKAILKIYGFEHMFEMIKIVSSSNKDITGSISADKTIKLVLNIIQNQYYRLNKKNGRHQFQNKENYLLQNNRQQKTDRIQCSYGQASNRNNRQELYLSLSLLYNPNKALEILDKLQDIEWIYGRMYEQGNIFEINNQKALNYYDIAIKKGNPDALYRKGVILQKQDNYQYIKLWEMAAKLGHLQAITDLGYLYQKGSQYTQINLQKAHEYYLKGTQQKFPRSMNNLASFYLTNPQIARKFSPIDLFKKASKLGYNKAYLNLAICYQKGKQVAINKQEAFRLFKIGAQKNDQESKLFYVYNLIQMHGKGLISQEDQQWNIAHQYCLQIISTNQEKPQSYYFLGYMYQVELGCLKEEHTSFLYYLKAAKLEYPAAINKIGDFYHSGFGVQMNKKEAHNYYMKAAQLKYPQALINLAIIYEQGYDNIVAKNPKLALDYYKMASDLGSSQAKFMLGMLYEQGKNVRKDDKLSRKYLEEASALGNQEARMILQNRRKN